MNLEYKTPKKREYVHGCPSKHDAPIITVNVGKWSVWTISQHLRRMAGLEAGQKAMVARDKDTGAWYIGFSKTGDGNTLTYTGGKYGLVFRNKEAAKELLAGATFARYLVMPKPQEQDGISWYKILTDKPLYSDSNRHSYDKQD